MTASPVGYDCLHGHMDFTEALKPPRESSGLAKEEALTIALREFIARREQARTVELFGTLDWDEGCNHKADRRDLDGEPVE